MTSGRVGIRRLVLRRQETESAVGVLELVQPAERRTRTRELPVSGQSLYRHRGAVRVGTDERVRVRGRARDTDLGAIRRPEAVRALLLLEPPDRQHEIDAGAPSHCSLQTSVLGANPVATTRIRICRVHDQPTLWHRLVLVVEVEASACPVFARPTARAHRGTQEQLLSVVVAALGVVSQRVGRGARRFQDSTSECRTVLCRCMFPTHVPADEPYSGQRDRNGESEPEVSHV